MIKYMLAISIITFSSFVNAYPGKCDLSLSPEENARSADADENTYQTCVDMLAHYKADLNSLKNKYDKGLYSIRGSVLNNTELKEIGIKTGLPYLVFWELNQITNKWIFYTNEVLLDLPGGSNFLIAIKRSTIKNLEHITLKKNEKLFARFQYLGKLEKKTLSNRDGFDLKVVFFEAVYPSAF